MSIIGKVSLFLFLIFAGVFAWFFFGTNADNQMDRLLSGDKPIGIRLVFLDQTEGGTKSDLAAQLVIFPAAKSIVVYSVNTDAALDKSDDDFVAIRDHSPSFMDFFEEISEVDSRYYIHLNKQQLERAIDLVGGFSFFLEHNEVYAKSRFQYPRGKTTMPGAQVAEYIGLRIDEKNPEKKHLIGVERLYRAESIFLSGFWNLREMLDQVSAPELWGVMYSLLESNLKNSEVKSLASFLSDKKAQCYMLEAPLETGDFRSTARGESGKGLYVKKDRAKEVFATVRDRILTGVFRSGAYHADVLNGTEKGGLAKRVKQYIQSDKLQVLDVDNFPYKPVTETIILDRSGSTVYPARLAHLTGLERSRVFFKRMPLDVQATLVIGKDFDFKKIKLEE